jgi:hypothetical protein
MKEEFRLQKLEFGMTVINSSFTMCTMFIHTFCEGELFQTLTFISGQVILGTELEENKIWKQMGHEMVSPQEASGEWTSLFWAVKLRDEGCLVRSMGQEGPADFRATE